MTKKGDSMAFITLEDFDGEIKVTLFPNVFNDTFNVALVDEIVIVEGRVESGNDGIQIFANKVTAAEVYAADFWLTIPAQLETPETLKGLQKIFTEHAGWSQVFLNRLGKWKKIAPKISDSAVLRKQLRNLLGAENVRLY